MIEKWQKIKYCTQVILFRYNIQSYPSGPEYYVKNDSQTSGLVLRNMKANSEGQLVLIL